VLIAVLTSFLLKFTKLGDFLREPPEEGASQDTIENNRGELIVQAVVCCLFWPIYYAIKLVATIFRLLGKWGAWIIAGLISSSSIDLNKKN